MKLTTVLLCVSLCGSAFAANIVQNPGFETGDLTSWADPNLAWDVNNTMPNSGNYAAGTGCVGAPCITGNADQVASLTQTLVTVAGQSYILSFAFVLEAGTPAELKVLFGNTTAFDLVNTPFTGSYGTYSKIVMATSAATDLVFLGRHDPDFLTVDDISVSPVGSAVPEPSTFLLLAGLLPVIVALRRRKETKLLL